jgi:hypothetical protein
MRWASPMLGALACALTLFVIFRFFGPRVGISLDYSGPSALQIAVSRILDSESFLTTLRSALPRGKDDEEYGMDYVPFMLHSIDERRKRAARSARLFLLTTIVAALTFSTVVVYFGYILVNEAAAGTAKSLTELKATTEKVSESLGDIEPYYRKNPKFMQEVDPVLYRLQTPDINPGPKNKEAEAQISRAIMEGMEGGDIVTLSRKLAQARAALSRDGAAEQNYAKAVDDASNKLTAFISSQSSTFPELESRAGELKVLVSKADDALSKPENRTPEIIKRLALGLDFHLFPCAPEVSWGPV